jgi:very-short-patch-repair endonuclease
MPKVPNVVIGRSPGRPVLERARALRREMTEEERMLWAKLRGNRLNDLHFRRQQAIDRFIVDFYCHAQGLVIEVDGAIHRSRSLGDRQREEFLRGLGLTVLRVSNEQVRYEMDSVLDAIGDAVALARNEVEGDLTGRNERDA